MLRRSRSLILALACLLAFGLGVTRLLQLRLAGGDVYPDYSSLRADPRGAKAFFRALAGLPETDVTRRLNPLEPVSKLPGGALLALGADIKNTFERQPRAEIDGLEAYAARGGRVVIAFRPVAGAGRRFGQITGAADSPDDDPSEDLDEERFLRNMKPVELTGEWEIGYGFLDLPLDAEGKPAASTAERVADLPLPESITCRTAMHFTDLGDEWTTLYAREGRPVIVERRMGRGSLAMSADSYLFSNEAMLLDREATLLAWFIGDQRTVVFDELHHGVLESPGIASLIRRYRLHGVVLVLLTLAGLYIWRNSTALVPPDEEQLGGGDDAVIGRDAVSGFVNLLRRGVPRSRLMATCAEEWRRSRGGLRNRNTDRERRMEAALRALESGGGSRPIAAYRELSHILKDKKHE